ncbi:hypothetical protein BKA70DRAFT_1222329 [Coprinopsis sp. MPI-PUGE-AT-0042]|nr:hypothetical protein BKA70DRAFT_1222329 [Coprinopsis sp. MPI-PUGE-AT-0042]
MPKDTTPTPNRLLRNRHRRSLDDYSTTKTMPDMYRVLKAEDAVEDHIVEEEPIPLDLDGEASNRGDPELPSETTGSTSRAARKRLGPNNCRLPLQGLNLGDGGPVIDKEQVLATLERLEKQALTRKKAAERMKTKLEEAKQQIAELQQELDEKDESLKSSQENEVQYRNWWLNEVQFMKLMLNKVPNPNRDVDLSQLLDLAPNHPNSGTLGLESRDAAPLYAIASSHASLPFHCLRRGLPHVGAILFFDLKVVNVPGKGPMSRCADSLPFLANMVEHVAGTSQLLVRSEDDIALRDRVDWVLEVEWLLETEVILPTAYGAISVPLNVVDMGQLNWTWMCRGLAHGD